MDFIQLLTNSLTLEIIVGLGTVIVGTLAANKYESYRNRAVIEITPAHNERRLGFALTVKRKTLNRLLVLFYGGFTRPQFGDLHKCDLYDADGNIYKEDFIVAGGRPVYIFPMVAETQWSPSPEKEDSIFLMVDILDSTTRKVVHHEALPSIPRDFDGLVSFPLEPKPSDRWYASVQVIADGLGRQELQRFHLALEAIISGYQGSQHVNFRLHAKREPYPMRWV